MLLFNIMNVQRVYGIINIIAVFNNDNLLGYYIYD